MSAMKRCAALALAATVALAATGCAANDDSGASDDGPIKIGASLDLTAYLASFDRGVRDGVRLAAKELNAKGGVLDRDVELVTDDMKADPQQGVRSVQKLIDQDRVAAFANGFSSAAAEAVVSQLERAERPLVVASVIPDDAAWEFSTLPSPDFETGVRIQYLQKQGIRSLAVLHDPTPYNAAQLKALRTQAKAAGIEVSEVIQHKADAVDLRPQITRLLRGRPGAIVKLSAGPTHIVAAKALASAGSRVPLLLGIEALDTMRKASASYDQTLFVAAPPQVYSALRPDERSPALTSLVEKAPKGQDLTYVGRGYDAVLLLAEAIRSAGSTDGGKVRDALNTMKPFRGTSGTYQFTAKRHYGLATNPLVLARVGATGDPSIVLRPSR